MKFLKLITLSLSSLLALTLASCGNSSKEQHTITFIENGGSEVSDLSGKKGEAVTLPTDSTKEGYIFDAWYIDKALTAKYSGTQFSNEDLTLYARWKAKSIQFTLDVNGGYANQNGYPSKSSTGDSELDDTPNLLKDKYYHSGYDAVKNDTDTLVCDKLGVFVDNFTSTDFKIVEGKLVVLNDNSTATIYAQWTYNIFTMSFESNGGSEVASIIKAGGATITAPTAPTRQYYTFAGWYDNAELTGSAYVFATMPQADIKLYAKWNTTYLFVNFVTNCSASVAMIATNVNALVAKPADPVNAGYTFVGWYDTEDFSSSIITWPHMMGNTSETFYAKWKANSMSVVFDYNGGSLNSATSSNATWTTGVVPSDIPLPASALADKYCVGYSSVKTDLGTKIYNRTNGLVAFSNASFNFSLVADDKGVVTPIIEIDGLSNTIYAIYVFKPLNVTMYQGYGDNASASSTTFAGSIATITIPTSHSQREGYILSGFNDANDVKVFSEIGNAVYGYSGSDFSIGSSDGVLSIPAPAIKASISVTATWNKNNCFALFVDASGASISNGMIYTEATSMASVMPATNPTKSGYVFSGWCEGATASESTRICDASGVFVSNYTGTILKIVDGKFIALNGAPTTFSPYFVEA